MKIMKIGKLPKKTDLAAFYASDKNKIGMENKLKKMRENSAFGNYRSINDQEMQNHNCEYKSEIKKLNLTVN
jgi:hypothetical protein